MRTLDEIVAAVRSSETCTEDELVYAVVAFDVLLSQLKLDEDPQRLQHWMAAAINSPKEYAGPCNDPANPQAVAWYKAMHGAGAFRCADCDCKEPENIDADHSKCLPF